MSDLAIWKYSIGAGQGVKAISCGWQMRVKWHPNEAGLWQLAKCLLSKANGGRSGIAVEKKRLSLTTKLYPHN